MLMQEEELQLAVLQTMAGTEDADIDFLLAALVANGIPILQDRATVASFRRQLIIVAVGEAWAVLGENK